MSHVALDPRTPPRGTSQSYYEASARARVAALCDAGSFYELLPPTARVTSPHLKTLDMIGAFDDGICIGEATLGGKPVLIAAQEGAFMGGAVGEVHGAKLVGLLERALETKPAGVVLLLESGGVRLHEANAGLIAVSEIMRALVAVRLSGIPVVVLIGGQYGCFGGMAIAARLCDAIIMSEEGRLGLSGPEVIETAMGVEEFDSRDRALVWRTTGGKHRFLLGEATTLVPDDVLAFRAAALQALEQKPDMSRDAVQRRHANLLARARRFAECADGFDIWRALGIGDAQTLPLLGCDGFLRTTHGHRAEDVLVTDTSTRCAVPRKEADGAAPQALLKNLFPNGVAITQDGLLFTGAGTLGAEGQSTTFAIIGTCGHAAIGHSLALHLADAVLATLKHYPKRPILLLIDTQGQRLAHHEELLGLNGYLAHLALCLGLARACGHTILGLVYEEAVSGGFLASALFADACYALKGAQVHVMNLPAMAKITKIPQARLEDLSQSSPVFAPGAQNYWIMGAVADIWNDDDALSAKLLQALSDARATHNTGDMRRALGAARGGRTLAHAVARKVREGHISHG